MEEGEQSLLSSIQDDQYHIQPHDSQIQSIASYEDEQDDVVGFSKAISYFFREFYVESKKLWYLAAPAILASGCQYSLGAITQVFAGQLGTTELAMFSVENSIIAGFGYGIMVCMYPHLPQSMMRNIICIQIKVYIMVPILNLISNATEVVQFSGGWLLITFPNYLSSFCSIISLK